MQNQRDFGSQIPSTLDNCHWSEWFTPEIAPGMVFQLADGTIQACNAGAENILGFTLAQMQNSTLLDHLWQTIREDGSPFSGDAHPTMVALQTGQPVVGVVMGIYQPNGNLIWIKINAQPLFKAQSSAPWAVVTTFWDVTVQKKQSVQAESAMPSLQPQSEQQIRTVLVVEDCAEDREMYCRYLQQDKNHTYIILSAETGDAGLNIYRTTPLDVVLLDYRLPDYEGLEFITAMQAQSSNPPPLIVITGQGNEAIAIQILKAGAKDYLIKGQFSEHELQHAVDCAINNAQLKVQLQRAVEQERLVTQIAKDTTQRLRESQERLQLGIQVAGVALAKFDYTTDTVELSEEAAALYGIPASELTITRDRIHDTFHPDERAELLGMIEQVLDPTGAGWFACEHRVVWQTGEVRWLDVRKQVFFNRSGDALIPAYAILAAVDITDRKQAELDRERLLQQEYAARSEAERANRIKDEFLAVLSHELRSPLNPILGWAKLLQQHRLDETRTQEALATIQRNAQLQAQLIDDLLDISRIIQGKLTLTATPVSLTFVISAALETVQLAADSKNIQFNLALPNCPMLVLGDAGRLQQIVWNLLSNAVKFTNVGGRVEVRLTEIGSFAQIQIIDTGKGINPDFLPYVFEHFRQEDGATTRKFGGLGLGLAIVRQLVELHGGTVGAESAGEGKGATFTVRLPLLELPGEPVNQSNDALPSPHESQPLVGLKIIIVDDEPDSRDFTAFVLEQAGADAYAISSAIEALQVLQQIQPDLIISDIGMPEMDGYMLIEQIRTQLLPPYRSVKAIALTAYAGEANERQVLKAGFQKHLAKPVDPGELIAAITRLVISIHM
jgi:PAS domain S-box-containing protein